MKKRNTPKLLSLLLAALLVLQLAPLGSALADNNGEVGSDVVGAPVPGEGGEHPDDGDVLGPPEGGAGDPSGTPEGGAGDPSDTPDGGGDTDALLGAQGDVGTLADDGRDMNGDGRHWAVIHKTDGTSDPAVPSDWNNLPPGGLKSSITIKDKNGAPIPPEENGNYIKIPAEAKIELTIGFHLPYPNDEPFVSGDYFEVALPSGLNFGPTSGTIEDFATWTIADGKVKVTLTDITNIVAKVWGRIEIRGTFKYLPADNETGEKTQIDFGGQIISIDRRPGNQDTEAPPKSTLSKSHEYNPSTNEITWTVTVTPPVSEPTLDYGGFKLIDTLTGDHTYVADSFNATGHTYDSNKLVVSGKVLTYTFPAGTTGVQTITYKTTPSFTGGNATNAFKNEASLYKGPHDAAVKNAESTFSMGSFFTKVGGTPILVSTGSGTDMYVPWTVNVKLPKTPSGVYTFPNVRIIDELPTPGTGFSGHVFVNTTVTDSSSVAHDFKAKIKAPGGTAADVGVGDISVTDGTLTYTFPAALQSSTTAEQTWELTYYTKVSNWDSTGANENADVKVKNKANVEWDPDGVGGVGPWGPGVGIGVEKVVSAAGGQIRKSTSGAENLTNSTAGNFIRWQIDVNDRKLPMTNASVTDAVQPGHDFVISESHPVTVVRKNEAGAIVSTSTFDGYSTLNGLTLTASAGGFKLTLPAAEHRDTYTITFDTKINQSGYNAMYKNGSKIFENKATLNANGTTGITVNATKTFNLEMLKKTAEPTYDYQNRAIQWKLVVNRNKLPMTSVVVTDTLPTNTTLLIDAGHPFTVARSSGGSENLVVSADASGAKPNLTLSEDGKAFTLNLPDSSDQFTITFWTHIEDAALLNATAPSFTNKAELDLTERSATLESEASKTVQNPVITKKHDYTPGSTSDVINWTVAINPGRTDLTEAVIEDTLNNALRLVEDSVALYPGKVVDANGTLAIDETKPAVTDFSVEVNGQTFTVALPDGPHAYVLVFQTAIVSNANITNTIHLKGADGSSSGQNTTTGVSVEEQYSKGGSGSYTLRVKKVDAHGEPLQGVEFTLWTASREYRRNGAPTERVFGVTDENGILDFTKLPGWVLYVKETGTPMGYVPLEGLQGGVRPTNVNDDTAPHITIKNDLAVADVEFTKVSSADKPDNDPAVINGGTFELSGEQRIGGTYRATATAENNKVLFKNVPVGGPYTIKELVPPVGYSRTDKILSVAVVYDASGAAVAKAQFTGTPVLENTPAPYVPNDGQVGINKVDQDGKPLAGAAFTLYDAEGKAIATAVSGADGVALFTGLAANSNFTVRETAAPEGYEMTGEVFSVATGIDTVLTFTAVNKKISDGEGSVNILKTDADGAPLSGAVFTLYDAEGAAIATAVSGANGIASFAGIPAKAPYTIRETAAPAGYLLSAASFPFTLADGQTLSFTIVNQKLDDEDAPTGSVTINKVSHSGQRLAGAEFTLYDAEGNAFASTVTGEDGVAVFTNLPLGSAYILETRAPAGYQRFAGAQHFVITEESLSLSFTLRDSAEDEDPELAGWEEDDIPTDVPMTSDPRATTALYLLFAGLVVLAGGVVLNLRKKNEK